MRSKWQQTIRNSARNNLQFVPEIQQKINRNTPHKKKKKKKEKTRAPSSAAAKQLKSGNWMKRSSWRRTQRGRWRQLDWLVTHRFAVKSLKSLCCLGRLNLLSCVPTAPPFSPVRVKLQFLSFSFSFSYENSFGERKMSRLKPKQKQWKMLWIWMRDFPLLFHCYFVCFLLFLFQCLSAFQFLALCAAHAFAIGSQV